MSPVELNRIAGASSQVIDCLVRTNWLRTAAWTLTFLIALALRGQRTGAPP